jgi:hypothetical protein
MVRFACPRCGQTTNIEDRHVGRASLCGGCGAELRVAKSPTQSPIDIPAGPADVRSKQSTTALIGLLLFAVLLATVWYWTRHNKQFGATEDWSSITPTTNGEILVQLDQFQGLTTASVGGINDAQWKLLVGNGDGTYKDPSDKSDYAFYGCFQIFYKGSTLQTPAPSIYFQLTHYDPNSHVDMPTDYFYFLIDGQRSPAKVISSHEDFGAVEIPTTTALDMAHAESVEFEAGDSQFKLTDRQLQGLRDFLSAIGFKNVGKPG